MPDTRIAVFIDYQNVYHSARDLFFFADKPSPILGHVHPLRFGELLCGLGKVKDPRRVLTGVRIYRGQPDSRSGMKLSRAFDRQVEAWKQMPGVTVRTRPLRYHRISKPVKGPNGQRRTREWM